MSEVELFCWVMGALSVACVLVWTLVLLLVCHGAWCALGDAWRAVVALVRRARS